MSIFSKINDFFNHSCIHSTKPHTSVLFIIKQRDLVGCGTYINDLSTGLLNSATFVCAMLNDNQVTANLEIAIDNNCIDKLVSKHKPTHVVIEAFWVIPEKFEVLQKLYPNVIWIVRNHSEIPFLATEGIAIEWIKAYVQYKNVYVASNSKTSVHDLKLIVNSNKVLYLPNYYIKKNEEPLFIKNNNELHIGCFGAIRPLKNQLVQAIAAINYANIHNKNLFFHMNAFRIEQGGNPVAKNIANLFNGKHKLVSHNWLNHNNFCSLVRSMDVVLCVSLTETFCIVAADAISQHVPVVVSKEVFWVNTLIADTANIDSITDNIYAARASTCTHIIQQQRDLQTYLQQSIEVWLNMLKNKL